MQQIEGEVILFKEYTEEEIVRFNPSDASAILMAQRAIDVDNQLSPEEKSSAHFWSGYFYACARGVT